MWTKEWPTKPGHYWFYGKRFEDMDPEMYLVKVWKLSDGFAYICESSFMYRSEGTDGWWMPAQLPEPPKEDE
jgi:hypothetical protein